MTPSPDRIPILIVAGFLGAGKTTLIRELLPRLVGGPRVPYVILNDFINAAIDTFTLKGLGAEVQGLAAGCVCCEDSAGLIDAILRVPVSIRPLVIIEANGTTDPYRLIETLALTPSLREIAGPILQVTIINEARWGKRMLPGDKHTERAQVRTASAVVTNRSEIASDKQRRRLHDDLLELNPRAPRLDANAFIDFLLRDTAATSLPEPDMSHPIPHSHHHSTVLMTPPTMTKERLRQWLILLPKDVLRVKGLVRITETDMAYVSRTDNPFEEPRIVPTTSCDGVNPAVVFIGPGLSEDFLRASFHKQAEACVFRL
jgi:G3E family GTPase